MGTAGTPRTAELSKQNWHHSKVCTWALQETFLCSAPSSRSIPDPIRSLSSSWCAPAWGTQHSSQQNCPASASVPPITALSYPKSRVCCCQIVFVLPPESRTAGFGALTLFPLSGRTNPAFNHPNLSEHFCCSSVVSQHCHSDALTNILPEFCHVVLVPVFVLWFILTCVLFWTECKEENPQKWDIFSQ